MYIIKKIEKSIYEFEANNAGYKPNYVLISEDSAMKLINECAIYMPNSLPVYNLKGFRITKLFDVSIVPSKVISDDEVICVTKSKSYYETP